jgi:hypothetical protein
MGVSFLSDTSFGQPLLKYFSGTDLTIANNQTAATTMTPSNGALRAAPWVVRGEVTFTAMRIEFTGGVAGNTLRFGLYTDKNGYPDQLVPGSDVGDISGASAAVVATNYATPIKLKPGRYWQVCISSTTTNTVRALTINAIEPTLGHNPGGGGTPYTGWSVGASYGAMPQTYPGSATLGAGLLAPMAMYRVQ